MLSLNATVEGDKVVIAGLQGMEADMPHALRITLAKGAKGTMREAFDFLNGAGAMDSNIAAGGYPVPKRTGHLQRMLDFLAPQKTPGWTNKAKAKTVNGSTFATGDLEAMVYDSAIYSRSIHDGTGSSAKFGARPFITDGFEAFNRGDKLSQIADEEVTKVITKRGFK